jgi:hypothetical protein
MARRAALAVMEEGVTLVVAGIEGPNSWREGCGACRQ